AVHPHAPIADVRAAARLPPVVPEHVPVQRVHRQALSADETYRMPFTCKIDPDRRGDPLVDPGMFSGFSATPPVIVTVTGGPKNPPSPPPAPAVRRLTHASERCRTLVVSICVSVR